MSTLQAALMLLLLPLTAGTAAAQGGGTAAHQRMTMPGAAAGPAAPTAGPQAPSSKAYAAASEKMMAAMNRPLSDDADRDFVAGMLPHHQGAVDMAQVELRFGRNPALRRLAQRVVVAQEKEIAEMEAWLRAHPAR